MSHVTPQRSGTAALPGFYSKNTTEGDASRFLGAEAGQRAVIKLYDCEPIGPSDDGYGGYSIFRAPIPFTYLVGMNQLQISTGNREQLTAGLQRLPDYPSAVALYDPEDIIANRGYYEEESSRTVLVYNTQSMMAQADPPNSALFFYAEIPHTAIPAEHREKVTIRDQGDNTGVELLGPGDGMIFKSAQGSRFLVRVDNSGNVTVEPR